MAEHNNAAVVLLCGIPASGKSTLASEIQRYVRNTRGDTVHVLYICYDDLIPPDLDLNDDIAGRQLLRRDSPKIAEQQNDTRLVSNVIDFSKDSLWKQYRRRILEAVDRILNMIKSKKKENSFDLSAIANGDGPEREGLPSFSEFWNIFKQNLSKENRKCPCFTSADSRLNCATHVILLDDNMYYHSMRYEYVQLARKYSVGFAEVFLDCHLETAVERNSLRSHPISLYTMQTMCAKMEPPDPEKFPWEKFHLTLKAEDELNVQTMEKVIQLFLEARMHPVMQDVEEDSQMKEASRLACLTSIIYQADQILRKYITKVIAEAKGNGNGKKELQSLASNLNKQKKAFLESLHNLKNLPECCNKMQTTSVPSGHCGADNEESTAMTLRSVPSKLSPGHFISSQSQSRQPETDGELQDYLNNFPWASCLVNEIQRTHLCLNCFPKLEAREEFQFFVENLFIGNVGSNDH